jgi:hypothetical protein
MIEFGNELRREAVTDRLMRITGVDHYITIILVPELAVILVKKNIKVCDESVRQILHERARLEDILHEDV